MKRAARRTLLPLPSVPVLPPPCYRSHFGSRYTSGRCARRSPLSFFAQVRFPPNPFNLPRKSTWTPWPLGAWLRGTQPGQNPCRTYHFASGHTAMNTPDPIRTRKLSIARPGQYWGGGPPGKPFGCRWLFVLPCVSLMLHKLLYTFLATHAKRFQQQKNFVVLFDTQTFWMKKTSLHFSTRTFIACAQKTLLHCSARSTIVRKKNYVALHFSTRTTSACAKNFVTLFDTHTFFSQKNFVTLFDTHTIFTQKKTLLHFSARAFLLARTEVRSACIGSVDHPL